MKNASTLPNESLVQEELEDESAIDEQEEEDGGRKKKKKFIARRSGQSRSTKEIQICFIPARECTGLECRLAGRRFVCCMPDDHPRP